eukprot:6445168-Amphidinium_carterae.1
MASLSSFSCQAHAWEVAQLSRFGAPLNSFEQLLDANKETHVVSDNGFMNTQEEQNSEIECMQFGGQENGHGEFSKGWVP